MRTHSTRGFYRKRRLMMILACASPLMLLGGAWWLVDDVLLVPPVPGETATAQECVAFMVDQKGLPRLPIERRTAFVQDRLRRFLERPSFRERFLSALRRSTQDEQAAFRSHLFDALKPLVMADIRRFHASAGAERIAYLDERIVEYNRLATLVRSVQIDKTAVGNRLSEPGTWVELLWTGTTEQERSLGAAYFDALGRRAAEIQADPVLKRELEARIAASATP